MCVEELEMQLEHTSSNSSDAPAEFPCEKKTVLEGKKENIWYLRSPQESWVKLDT